jgi:hypothetical protein
MLLTKNKALICVLLILNSVLSSCHLLCAFAYINSSTYNLSINSSTEQKFSTFTDTVKRNNPLVTTLLSIWVGREDSLIFFSMINQSSIETVRFYGFHGQDFFGILPSKSSDMINFDTLLNEWRIAMDSEAKTLVSQSCSWSWPLIKCQLWIQ